MGLGKVIYRGFGTSELLQKMHDDAVAKRTKLRLASDSAEVEQAQQAMELRCKQERSEREQQLAEAEARFKIALLALENEQKLREQDKVHEQALRHAQELAELELKKTTAANDEESRRLGALKTLGVDLTKYVVSVAAPPPDKHLRIESATNPALHLDMK